MGKKKEVREKGRDEDSEEKEAAIKKNDIALKKKTEIQADRRTDIEN